MKPRERGDERVFSVELALGPLGYLHATGRISDEFFWEHVYVPVVVDDEAS